ncbi:AbrB/MazE/SpoVT family DNA-binding domain-containing protein [Pseudomonas huanghezhanensis]|uniref:AbrB/MazE/SpoVT family DNA-binding domain-containing protein n=1 Tax=Pseudomonas huanghezhanensis TaxID=3002903 RepID=UPI002285A8F5|nr:AbrB/MazE/SpoVT family DNA-binding domain-containing protein [Pseudomonas sp. BSw22131]
MQTTVVCQDPGDGSGNVIINLHPDALKALNTGLSDSLSIELADGSLVLKPIREVDAKS